MPPHHTSTCHKPQTPNAKKIVGNNNNNRTSIFRTHLLIVALLLRRRNRLVDDKSDNKKKIPGCRIGRPDRAKRTIKQVTSEAVAALLLTFPNRIIMSLAYEIKWGSLSRLSLTKKLQDKRGESFDDIVDAIKDNEFVKEVYLGPYLYSNLSDQQRSFFIQRLGQDLCNLKSLSIGTLEHTRACISGESIGRCIQQAKRLHTIRVERDITWTSIEELQLVAEGLQNHPTLQRVSFLSLNPTVNEAACLDTLLFSLSTISNLESLQLCISSTCSMDTSLTPTAVASLGKKCHKLSWLYLARFPLHDEHMLALFEAIGRAQDRPALKVLDFPQSAKLTIQSWNALFDLLQTNVNLDSVNMYAPPCAKETRTIIYAFLALNRDGKRSRLRDCKDIETWIQLTSRFTSLDQNVLFAIVRENPLVCSL